MLFSIHCSGIGPWLFGEGALCLHTILFNGCILCREVLGRVVGPDIVVIRQEIVGKGLLWLRFVQGVDSWVLLVSLLQTTLVFPVADCLPVFEVELSRSFIGLLVYEITNLGL